MAATPGKPTSYAGNVAARGARYGENQRTRTVRLRAARSQFKDAGSARCTTADSGSTATRRGGPAPLRGVIGTAAFRPKQRSPTPKKNVAPGTFPDATPYPRSPAASRALAQIDFLTSHFQGTGAMKDPLCSTRSMSLPGPPTRGPCPPRQSSPCPGRRAGCRCPGRPRGSPRRAAEQGVVAMTVAERVLARLAEQGVVAPAAAELVLAVAAADHVVAGSTHEDVAPTEADDHIRTRCADIRTRCAVYTQLVAALRTHDRRREAVAGSRWCAWWRCALR